MVTNAKGAARASAATQQATGAATGGAWGNQANYDQQPDGTYKSRIDGSVIPADQYWNLQAQQQQARQTGQASIDAYNAAQPGFWGQVSNAGQAILPMAVGGLTGGPWGAAVGALGTIKVLDAQGQKEAAVNQGVQTAAAAGVNAQRKAAGTYVTPYGTPNPSNPGNGYNASATPAGSVGGYGSTSSPLGTVPGGASGITPQINNMLTTYQNRTAPSVAPVTVGSPQQAQASYSTAPTLGATQQANATNATAARVGPAERASASLATAANLGPSAQANAQQANSSLAGQTTIDQGQSNQTRGQQQTSLSDLFSASRGLTPSAAELQLRQTTDRNVANQLALASALQGRSVGGALKQASDASGQINAQAAADSAVLRAQEQAQARNAYSSALSGVRGQDIGVAESQAGLTQGVNLANAQNLTGVSQSNAALGTGVSQSNAALQNAQDQQRAAFQQATALQNAQNQTGVSQFNAGQGNQLTAEQAQLANAVAMQNANNQTGVSQFNAGQGNQMSQYQAGLQSASALQNAQLGTQTSQFNAGQANTLIGQQATIQQQSAMANVDAQLKQQGLDDQQRAAFLQALVTSKGQDITGANQAQANANALALGQGNLALQNAIAAWAKTKDVVSGVGALATGAGASDYIKQLLANGSAPGYTPPGNNSGLDFQPSYPGNSPGGNDPTTGEPISDSGISDGGT